MSFSSLATLLTLVTGLSLSPQGAPSGFKSPAPLGPWNPVFDYTNLPPPNTEFWADLQPAKVPMEGAIRLARETEKVAVRPLKVALRPGPEGATWYLELFVGDEPDQKRVNLTISTAEEKVLRRLELSSIPPAEQALWPLAQGVKVPAEDSIEVAKKTVYGHKATPLVLEPRARLLQLVGSEGSSLWDIEMMGLDRKQQQPRRYDVKVDTQAPNFKVMLLLDRFAGTPLRRGVPTELDNGLVIYDFKPGEGEELTPASKVRVSYRLWLLDNTKVHDTFKNKQPETFLVSEAPLEGMRQGLLGMKVGGRRKICMPYTMAFGEAGGPLAPPRAMIVCDMCVDALVTD